MYVVHNQTYKIYICESKFVLFPRKVKLHSIINNTIVLNNLLVTTFQNMTTAR